MKLRTCAALLAAAVICGSNLFSATVVGVNTTKLITESKFGKELGKDREKQLETFRKFAMEKESALQKEEQELIQRHQAGKLPANKLEVELASLERKKRHAQTAIEEKRQDIALSLKQKELEIRGEIDAAVTEVAKKEGWSAVDDISAPNKLYVSNEYDKTTTVLKALDERAKAAQARATLAA